MGFQYDTIQPVAFDLRESPDRSITVHTLTFPEVWKQAVGKLQSHCATHRKTKAELYGLPVRTLNQALRAMVPGLLAILPGATRSAPSPWLVAWEPLPDRTLRRVANAWVRVMYQDRVQNHALMSRVLEEFRTFQPAWERRTWQAADWKDAPPPDDPLYHILPAIWAETITKPGTELFLNEKSLVFRRAQGIPGRPGSELFSWPPSMVFANERKNTPTTAWYYSVLLTLTLQTLPLKRKPVIHAEWGIRRWVSRPLNRVPWGTETSVFLSGQPLLDDDLSAATTFQVAPLSSTRNGMVWGSCLPELLSQWNLSEDALPDPGSLCADPVKALNLSGDRHAAIVYRPELGRHLVASGVPVAQRQKLTDELAARLAPWATLCPPLERCYPTGSRRIPWQQQPTTDPSPPGGDDSSHSEPLSVEIYIKGTDRPEVATLTWDDRQSERDVTKADTSDQNESQPRVSPALLLEKAIRQTQRLFSRNGVDIRWCPLGDLAKPLVGDGEEKRRQQLQRSALERLAQIHARTPATSSPIPAFVELEGKDDFRGGTDPKPILRLGLAQRGRLTQFFTPDKEEGIFLADDTIQDETSLDNCPPRIKSTMYDMLRQMGYIRKLPDHTHLGVPKLKIVGLWFLHPLRLQIWKRLPPLPVMVSVDTQTWQVSFWSAEQKAWRSYPEGLLGLARLQLSSEPGKAHATSPPTPGWLLQVIREQLVGNDDVLLLVHAANIRSLWPWLENRNVTLDGLAADNEVPCEADRWAKLRVVRIRDGRGGETPEWCATGDKKRVGLTAGLFAHPAVSRLFFSTYQPPSQFKYRRNAPLESPVWNPSLIEILPLMLQAGDDPVTWAAYVHELRRALPHYTEAVRLPLPLHLAAMAEEYALPIQWQQEEEI